VEFIRHRAKQDNSHNVLSYNATFCGSLSIDLESDVKAFLSPLVDVVRPARSTTRRFVASVKIYHLGTALLIQNRNLPFRLGRSIAKTKRDGLDHYVFYTPQSRGTAFVTSDMLKRPRRLDMIIADLSCPLDILIGAGAGIGLILPRLRLSPLLGEADGVHGCLLSGASPAGALFGRHLVTLARHAPELSLVDALGYLEAAALLASRCIAAAVRREADPPVSSAPRGLGARARGHIETHLHDPRLNANTLSDALHTSRTQLYRQFVRFGGIHRYIRNRRLYQAFDLICRPDREPRRISDIAYSLGFVSEAHFARIFGEHFGLSPRATRAAARRGEITWPTPPGGAEQNPLERWLRELTVA